VHPDEFIRSQIASHPLTSNDILLQLASDPDEWVRLAVARNRNATQEVKVAFALASTEELVERARDQAPGFEQLPVATENELERFVKEAVEREDIWSLWRHHFRGGWPSTEAFLHNETPTWLLDVFSRYGHPAALLHSELNAQPPTVEPWAALQDLIDSELLVRALWPELALSGLVKLIYLNDSHEGDQFFPEIEGLELMDSYTPAARIIGGYSDKREWLKVENVLSPANLATVSSAFGAVLENISEFDDDSLSLFTFAGLAWAKEWEVYSIALTPLGRAAFNREIAETLFEWAEDNNFDTEVTVVDSHLPKIGYAAISDDKKSLLTQLIRQARSHVMVSTWGLADHFLMCIALHPATPQSIRDQLLSDESEQVRQAVQIRAKI
jgi:hypothetical protein